MRRDYQGEVRPHLAYFAPLTYMQTLQRRHWVGLTGGACPNGMKLGKAGVSSERVHLDQRGHPT